MAANNAQQHQLQALLQQIDQLNANNQAFQLQAAADAQQIQAAALAAPAPPPPLPVISTTRYASCPGQHNSHQNLDFDKKTDLSTFNNGCKSIYDGEERFDGTTQNLTMFLTLLKKRRAKLAWETASNPQQITFFIITPPGGTATVQISIIRQYARIGVVELSQQCAHFMTGVDKENCTNKNNHMANCIHSSLTSACQLQLIQYEGKYTIAPLLEQSALLSYSRSSCV